MPIGINTNNFPQISSDKPGGSEAIRKNYQRLSSGFRINQASDDAAGMAISENLRALTRSLAQAEQNTGRAVSVTSVKEGGLEQIGNITARMRELAVQSADGALNETDRGYINEEFQALKGEIDRLSQSTEFNGQKLLAGPPQTIQIQAGAGTGPQDRLAVAVGGIDATTLGLSTLSVGGTDGSAALSAINGIDAALKNVNQARAENGATQNRLLAAQENTAQRRTNLTEANSRIRDADMAEETSQLARNQVLQRARIAVGVQANQSNSLALNLLK